MNRPYNGMLPRWGVNPNDGMEVIGHHHERVDLNAFIVTGDIAPDLGDDLSKIVEYHRSIGNLTEYVTPPLNDHRKKVRSGLAIVIRSQTCRLTPTVSHARLPILELSLVSG